ncbi:hypothetical protein [Pseudoduganella albidiflava]|uniref:hypothetical protein n=1 Tax=Pseudoduganella albidiflava TaxID=321983 RepID=UPI001E2BA78C|nr:hypothetical protein [Pseudoduganella albidiflava]
MRDRDFPYQLAAFVYAGVEHVAEVVLAMLFGPLRIDIFLGTFVRLQSSGTLPCLTVSASEQGLWLWSSSSRLAAKSSNNGNCLPKRLH